LKLALNNYRIFALGPLIVVFTAKLRLDFYIASNKVGGPIDSN